MFDKARALERKGEKLIHFELGEPDFETPQHIREAAKRALDQGFTHYTPNAGLLELREAIAEKLKKDNEIEVDPASEICVTVGSQEAAYLVITCTIEPGDEVLIADPAYYTYANCVRMAEGTPVWVPLRKENDFRLDPKELEKQITSESKMIVINSPSNPTGTMCGKEDLREIDEIARKNELLVLSDEIYEKLVYDGNRHYSIAALSNNPEQVITLNGFSKAYAMTGWRLGYVVASKQIISELVKVQQTAVSCPTAFAQKGAVEALRGPQDSLTKMKEEFECRRNIIIDGLNGISGLSVTRPKGAFYAFVDMRSAGKPSLELAELLLNEAKIVTTPGSAFGAHGEGYLRVSYATSIENINTGIEGIRRVLHKM
jgi:aspartate/methionine/tyrosine aminotransferase